jgi:hypothetical protein
LAQFAKGFSILLKIFTIVYSRLKLPKIWSEYFLKIFVARYGGKFDFLLPKKETNSYSVKIISNLIYK